MKGARGWVLRRRCLGGDGVGYVEDIIARTDAACLIDIHLKRISYQEAVHSGRLALQGPRHLTDAFMTWIRPSPYADVRPARLSRL